MRLAASAGLLLVMVPPAVSAQTCATFDRKDADREHRTIPVNITTRDAVALQLERSYFYPANGHDNLPPMLFEAQINTHFMFRQVPERVRPRFWRGLMAVASHRSDVRMNTGDGFESKPVRTPSYSPAATLFLPLGRGVLRCSSAFFQVRHFSNGQEDSTVLGGEVNYRTGSFSTNFVKVGYAFATTTENSFFHVRPAVEILFGSDSLVEADYGDWRAHVQYLAFLSHRRRKFVFGSNATLSQLDVYYHHNHSALRNRAALSYTLAVQPRAFEDFWLMVNAYRGPDYYNIWFKRYLTTYRAGIMANGQALPFR